MAEIVVGVLDLEALGKLTGLLELIRHHPGEVRRGIGEFHTVLRTLGARHGRHHGGEVQCQRIGEHGLFRLGRPEHVLRLGIFLDEGHLGGGTRRALQVADGLGIDREEAAGRAIFRRHVCYRRHVLERQSAEARAIEFHELADHALLAQHLRHGEHEVGGGRAFRQLAVKAEADHFRDQHGDGLAEHRGLGLDAAHTPAQNGKAVHHGGVRVGADQRVRVGIGDGLALHLLGLGPHRLGEVFEVHLVADAGTGRHDAEIVEGTLPPLEEGIALAVAVILEVHVVLERLRVGEEVDHHRVVDDEIDGCERIDLLRVLAEALHGVAHGGQIDHGGNAGEVLHQHAGRAEGDFLLVLATVLHPLGDRLNVGLGHRAAILEAQQVLEQHLQRIGQLRDALQAVLLGGLEAEIGIGLGADLEGLAALEAVERHRGPLAEKGWMAPF